MVLQNAESATATAEVTCDRECADFVSSSVSHTLPAFRAAVTSDASVLSSTSSRVHRIALHEYQHHVTFLS